MSFQADHSTYFAHFVKSGSIKSLIICGCCFFFVCVVAAVLLFRMFSSSSRNSTRGNQIQRQKEYDALLGRIRGLENLRHERELLVKRVYRIVSSWKKHCESSESIGDLGDDLRALQRDHHLTLRDTVAILGQADCAGVFRVHPSTNTLQGSNLASKIFQEALEKSVQKNPRLRPSEMTQIEDDDDDDDEQGEEKEQEPVAEQMMKKRK